MKESEFLEKYPLAERVIECDGKTAKAYRTRGYLWLFDRFDGHLAWKKNRHTGQVEFECQHIKIGRKRLRQYWEKRTMKCEEARALLKKPIGEHDERTQDALEHLLHCDVCFKWSYDECQKIREEDEEL